MAGLSPEWPAFLTFGSYRIDREQRLLFSDAEVVPLAPKVFDTLLVLVENQGRVVDKDTLLKRVWPDTFVEEGSLARNVSILRKVLGRTADDETFIETIPKRGYRFVAPVIRGLVDPPVEAAKQRMDVEVVGPPPTRWREVAIGLTLMAAVVAIGIAARHEWSGAASSPPVLRLGFTLPASEPFDVYTAGPTCAIALSADGTVLAYDALNTATSRTHVYVRRLDEFEARVLPGSEGAYNPFVSPDGRWVGFFSEDAHLMKAPVDGGPPEPVVKVTEDAYGGAEWEPDGTIVFDTGHGLARVGADGGAARTLTSVDEQHSEVHHSWPHLLPGGGDLLFTVQTASSAGTDVRVETVSLATGARRVLLTGAAFARYLPSGHLIYSAGGSIVGVPFDPVRVQVTGTPVKLLDDVAAAQASAHLSVARDGTVAYVRGRPADLQRRLVVVDASGKATTLPAPPRPYIQPRVSPDGTKVLVSLWQTGVADVWLYDMVRSTLSRVTSSGTNADAVWAPDGRSVVYQGGSDGVANLFVQTLDGHAPARKLASSSQVQWPHAVSRDGRVIFTQADPGPRNGNVWVLPLEAGGEPRPLLTPQKYEQWGGWPSSDGRWLAYVSAETGRFEVYVTDLPDTRVKWQISADGGQEPVWSPDGRQLFYRERDRMMSVTVGVSAALPPGRPVMMFAGTYYSCCPGLPQYDAMPGGGLLMIKDSDEQSFTELRFVKGWTTELSGVKPAP